MAIQIDNSKRSDYASCPRKYALAHVLGLKSNRGSNAMRYGSAFHGMHEGYYSSLIKGVGNPEDAFLMADKLGRKAWDEETAKATFDESDYRTYENCMTSFVQYIGKYDAVDRISLEVVETETLFCIPIELTDNEKFIYPHIAEVGLEFTGKLDLHALTTGQDWIWEVKTTGQSLGLQKSRLNRSPQLMGYNWAARFLGKPIMGNMVVIHHISSRKKQDGDWGAIKIDFDRDPQIFNQGDLESWRRGYLNVCEKIIADTKMYENLGVMKAYAFPNEFSSCFQFGPCQYIPLCNQNRPLEDLNTEGYHENFWNVLETGHKEE